MLEATETIGGLWHVVAHYVLVGREVFSEISALRVLGADYGVWKACRDVWMGAGCRLWRLSMMRVVVAGWQNANEMDPLSPTHVEREPVK